MLVSLSGLMVQNLAHSSEQEPNPFSLSSRVHGWWSRAENYMNSSSEINICLYIMRLFANDFLSSLKHTFSPYILRSSSCIAVDLQEFGYSLLHKNAVWTNGALVCPKDLWFKYNNIREILRETRQCHWFSPRGTPKFKEALKVKDVTKGIRIPYAVREFKVHL